MRELLIGILIGAVLGAGGATFALQTELRKLELRLERLEQLEGAEPVREGGRGELVFANDFRANGLSWGVKEEKDITFRIQNGKYLVDSRRKTGWLDWRSQGVPGLPPSYTVRLSMQRISGDPNEDAGLFLGWDNDNFLMFGMTPEGYSMVRLQKDGEWQERPLPGKSLSGVNAGNVELLVSVADKKATYFIDGKKVGRLSLKDFDIRRAGVYVSARQRVEFDSLVIEAGERQ